MTQPSEKIKEKLDIVDFIKNYVSLKPAGRNFKGNCPFHQERTPSFIVSKDRQIWHCFGCGAGGDIFRFLMNFENLEFHEALKVLAEKAGIELRSASPEEYRQFGVLYDISNAAKDFYLESFTKFPIAKNYLLKRGLKAETIEEFEVGFAPNEFDRTTTHLLQKGFKMDDIVRAGVAFKTDRGMVGDRFRGRIMFPIHDHSGKVVAFSGRILPELEDKTDMGKYVNSPETPVYNKSKILYGFWKTKKNIRDSRTALLVEGQMDFLGAFQSGLKNAVATSGTALTPEHLKALKPIADRIVISFDNDEAGLMAAEKGIDLLGSNDFSVLVLNLGSYKDPADAAIAEPEFLAKAFSEAKPAIAHYFSRYLNRDKGDKKKDVRLVLSKIRNIWSPIERANWLRELSHETGLSERDLRDEMDKVGGAAALPAEARPSAEKNASRTEILSERILGLLAVRGDFRGSVETKLNLMPQRYAEVYKALLGEGGELDTELKELVNLITLRSGIEYDAEPEDQREEMEGLLGELELEYLKERQLGLQKRVMVAESQGTEEDLAVELRKFDELSKRMQDIKNKNRHKKK